MANEFIQDSDKVPFDMHMWLPRWMPRLHGACMGFNSPLSWDSLLYSIGFEDCDTPYLTGLAFLTGPYGGVVQELAS